MIDWVKGALVVGAFAVALGVKIFWPNSPEDNFIEEVAEKVIKEETGVDIDLTPASPEDNKK